MRTRQVVATAAMAAAVGLTAILTLPAGAGTTPRQGAPEGVTPSRPAQAGAGLLTALQRDLKVSRDEAQRRLTAEALATDIEARLRAATGSAFGGAWVGAGTNRLTVAVTDPSLAGRVRAAGAEPRIVSRSRGQLEAARRTLDRRVRQAPALVSGWYVDPATNSVTLLAREGARTQARDFARRAGIARDAVRVREIPAGFTALSDVRGGDRYIINRSARCSVGFPVTTGFVSAGHCGRVGATTVGFDNTAQGTFRASKFGNSGGNDYAVVDVNRNWIPRPVVATADGEVPVAGSQEAPVGAAVCRTGSTTGTRCGAITARDVTLNVSGRTVTGFVVTDACAEPGDSGGSLLAGNQAQGVLSGGSGSCRGGRALTVYQPINPVLAAERLTLVTTGGGQAAPAPSDGASTQPAPAPTATAPTTTAPATPAPPTADGGSDRQQSAEAEVIRLVNQERSRAGCNPLTVDARLARVARAHSADMAANGFFGHTNRQGKSPSQRVTDSGYRFRATGENIASGQATPAAVMQAWMNSAGHRRNILNCAFRDIGVGAAFRTSGSRTTPFWTQVFGTPR